MREEAGDHGANRERAARGERDGRANRGAVGRFRRGEHDRGGRGGWLGRGHGAGERALVARNAALDGRIVVNLQELWDAAVSLDLIAARAAGSLDISQLRSPTP